MPSSYYDYPRNGIARWYTSEPAAFTMGGNGAGSGTSAREFQMPILPQSQISSGRPIWPNFPTTLGATWTSPISFAQNGNFFGLEYSNIPINNTNWDDSERVLWVLFLAQWNST